MIRKFKESDREGVNEILDECGLERLPSTVGKYAFVSGAEDVHGVVLGYVDLIAKMGFVGSYAVTKKHRNGFAAISLMQSIMMAMYVDGVERVMAIVPEHPAEGLNPPSTLLKLYKHFGAEVFKSYVCFADIAIVLPRLGRRVAHG